MGQSSLSFALESFVRKGITMKKRITLTMILTALVVSAAACSPMGKVGKALPEENSVMIDKEGNVSWISVEPYEDSDGTEEELKAWAENRISEFNRSLGKPALGINTDGSDKLPAAMASVTVGNGTASLITDYDTPSRLIEFASAIGDGNVPFTVLEAGSMESMGQSLEGVSFQDEEGKGADAQTVKADGEKLVIKSEGQGMIKTEGEILYVSHGCTLKDSKTVQTAPEGISYIVLK